MLAPAERDLELRQEIPVGLLAGRQFTIRQKFDHWGPHASKTHSLVQALAEGGSPVDSAVGFRRVRRQLNAALELEKALIRQELPVRSERFKDRDPGSETPGPIARRQDGLALNAQDGTGSQAAENQALVTQGDVADAAKPGAGVVMLKAERKRNFPLIPRAKTPLVGNKRGSTVPAVAPGQFYFRKGSHVTDAFQKHRLLSLPKLISPISLSSVTVL